jgi:hypothetical protein
MGLRRVDCKTGWITDSEGVSYCYLDGLLHREDGPAITHPDGRKIWYLHGKLHREDGPATVYPTGFVFWFLHGKRVEREDVLDTPEKREAYLLEESLRRL